MQICYIGVGSNLADPCAQVERALAALAGLPQAHLRRRSRLYRSAPWGMTAQPEFINAVAELATALPARALLDALLELERSSGRVRGGPRWGPRIIDLDLLLCGDCRIDEPGLRLPHPRLHERSFVLVPLAEIAPALELPGHGPIAAVLAGLDAAACQVVETP